MQSSYIWSLPTRIFHFSFALLITICLLTDDDLLTIHIISGYLILIPFTFRIGWGLFGPKYSKFKDFPLNIQKAKEFTKNIFDKEQKYIGHNPAASFVMILILLIIPFIIFSGMLTLGAEESKGIFSSIRENDLYEDIHELFSNIIYILIFLHLAGIAADRLLHKDHGTLNSIFKGYKNTEKNEGISLNLFQKIFSGFFFILFIILTTYLIFNTDNPFIN